MNSISDQEPEALLGVIHEEEFQRHFRYLIYITCGFVICVIVLLISLILYL